MYQHKEILYKIIETFQSNREHSNDTFEQTVCNIATESVHYCSCKQGCGVGRFFRIPTPDSSSFEKPTPTPAVLKNRLRLQQF